MAILISHQYFLLFFLGIMGSWEGYVPLATDLYLRGAISSVSGNIVGLGTGVAANFVAESGMISAQKYDARGQTQNYSSIYFFNQIDLVKYNYINLEGYVTKPGDGIVALMVSQTKVNTYGYYEGTPDLKVERSLGTAGNFTLSLNCQNFAATRYILIGHNNPYQVTFKYNIYRIWLS